MKYCEFSLKFDSSNNFVILFSGAIKKVVKEAVKEVLRSANVGANSLNRSRPPPAGLNILNGLNNGLNGLNNDKTPFTSPVNRNNPPPSHGWKSQDCVNPKFKKMPFCKCIKKCTQGSLKCQVLPLIFLKQTKHNQVPIFISNRADAILAPGLGFRTMSPPFMQLRELSQSL